MKKFILFLILVAFYGCVKTPVLNVKNDDWVFEASFLTEGISKGGTIILQLYSNKENISVLSIDSGEADGSLVFDEFASGKNIIFSEEEGKKSFTSKEVDFTMYNSSRVRSFAFIVRCEETGEERKFSLPYVLYGSDLILPESITIRTSSFESSRSLEDAKRGYIRYSDLESMEILFFPSDSEKEFTLEVLDKDGNSISSSDMRVLTFPSGCNPSEQDNDAVQLAIKNDTRQNIDKCLLYCKGVQASGNSSAKLYLAGGLCSGEVVLKIASLRKPDVCTYLRVWTRKRLNLVLDYDEVIPELHWFHEGTNLYSQQANEGQYEATFWRNVFSLNSAGRVYLSEMDSSFDSELSGHKIDEFKVYSDVSSLFDESNKRLSFHADLNFLKSTIYHDKLFLSHFQKLGKRQYNQMGGDDGKNHGTYWYACPYCSKSYRSSSYICIGFKIFQGSMCSEWNFSETATTRYSDIMCIDEPLIYSNGFFKIDQETTHYLNIWNDCCHLALGTKSSTDYTDYDTSWESVDFSICNIRCPKELDIVNFVRLNQVLALGSSSVYLGNKPWFQTVDAWSGKGIVPLKEVFSDFGETSKVNTVYYY